MKTYLRILLLAFCAFILAPAQAGDVKLKIEYAGVVYDNVDLINFPDTIVISDAAAKGSFGAMDVKVVSKFSPFANIPDYAPSCSTGVLVGMEFARSVTTFKDYSQLFTLFDDGYLCIYPGSPGDTYYEGRVTGHIIGGTGRFKDASGDVESVFDGYDVIGPFVSDGPIFPAFGSWSGVLTGTIELAH